MNGVDISVYQKNVNYISLKANGIDFAIIRAGYGKNESQKDNMFESHYAGCVYNGIKVGAYLYAYASTVEGAKLEAENCLKFIKNKKFDLPIFYDIEDKNQENVSKETLTKMCQVFCDTIINAGYQAGIYANLYWFNNKLNVKELEKYNIWLAQWNNKITANFRVDIWQYEVGNVVGYNGRIDKDICYKDYTQVVDNPVEKDNFIYIAGKTYTTQVVLKVRSGAGTNYTQKTYNQLTPNAKQHAFANGCLKVGTKVTCLGIQAIGNDIWIKIPSGWIAGYYNNKYYVK